MKPRGALDRSLVPEGPARWGSGAVVSPGRGAAPSERSPYPQVRMSARGSNAVG